MTDLEGAVERFTLDLIEIEDHINAERVRIVQHSDDDWAVRYLGDLAKDGRTILNALASITRERDEAREGLINNPETEDFVRGVSLEALHQIERWGADHDAGKEPLDWFWLIGYLAQKAAMAAISGDLTKAKHHTISTAAALANWHAQLSGKPTAMRHGVDADARGFSALVNGEVGE